MTKRLLQIAPALRTGLFITVVLAVAAAGGRIAVPIAMQQILDRGLPTTAEPDLEFVRQAVLVCLVAVTLTAAATYATNRRLARATESGLATLRSRAFRKAHDLPALILGGERRGALVSRVTGDVDQVSALMQVGGTLVLTWGQLVAASVLMLIYSWQLTLVVWASFVPFVVLLRRFRRRIALAYASVREQAADLLGAVGEAVVGSTVIQMFGATRRTLDGIDGVILKYRQAQHTALVRETFMFSGGELGAAFATGAVVVASALLGVSGEVSIGQLVAFLFLITMFIGPIQMGIDVLNQIESAFAGLRRVLGILDAPIPVTDPGAGGAGVAAGPPAVRFDGVHYAYPGGPQVLHDIRLAIEPGRRVAVVGRTGSGKTTLVKLLVRLMDPTAGTILINGVSLASVRLAALRRAIVLVPQDGFLFDMSILDNVRYGRPGASDREVMRVFDQLRLTDWLAGLPEGPATRAGQSGGSLSAGERQLVALARAHLADPHLLVLDEATSSVDPATEVRLQRALAEATHGRTSISIAHRLASAEAADEVLVLDKGQIVQHGHHTELIEQPGAYAGLHAAWATAMAGA